MKWLLAVLVISGTVKSVPRATTVKINGVYYKVVKAL